MNRPATLIAIAAIAATAGCASQELAAINAPASSTPQSCSAQLAVWRNDGNDDAMQAVVDGLSAVQDATAAWAQDLTDGADTSSDASQIDSAAGSLQSDAQSAQGNLPPSCVPGMRAADSAFLADAVKVAGKAEAGTRQADDGKNEAAVKDFLSAKGETGTANKKFDSAVSDAQNTAGVDARPQEPGVILECMVDSRPQADRILVAQLTGEARHRAKWRELTADEERAAVAALAELAGGRADLLAEVAGIFEGTGEGELDQPLVRQAAALCLKAGADAEAIPAWIEEGRRRRSAAGRPPPSGGVRGPRLASCDTPGSSEIRHRVILRRTVSPMSATKIRLTAVIMDILDVISNSPPDNPAWGLRLCEATGYGTGTVYPALDRLLQAGWIEDKWEEPAPADRPRRRYYEITSAGRVAYREALSARAARRKAWTSPALHARGAA